MMSVDLNYLTPRGLLVNKSFVCQGPSFSNLVLAIDKMIDVPYSKETMAQKSNFSSDAFDALLDVLEDCLGYMAEVLLLVLPALGVRGDWLTSSRSQINANAGKLKTAYRDVGAVCDAILVLSAAAPQDYNKLFDDLARLYKDESDNEALRDSVKRQIDARLTGIRNVSTKATATRAVLANSTDAVQLAQEQLKQVSAQLNTEAIYRRLLEAFMPDMVKIAMNNFAINMMRGWIGQIQLTEGTAASLTELQKAVGAVAEIDMDLIDLRKYVEENTSPGPGPILDLQKGNILEKWEDLDKEVRKFKANFIDTVGEGKAIKGSGLFAGWDVD
ncbi:uncharacterized protein MAM_04485 [Metarhizium album ARSEF 1941]|uniref:Uncharacterized protein n=1 Tax=Metarhizium album (strain ARSEF 1941) TaxID=1081103 RepID=A0A0B2WX70_METAS|nr:uncharacterized protein MAM_04485 [Metarhizium album ARSEF 1941]KHN97470.1 hypothetical protein MAM_04485 [Metarhizium album ARSEF 1941]